MTKKKNTNEQTIMSFTKKVKGTQSKLVNWRNAVPTKGEVNNEPSLTVPDQTLSIRDLLNRYVRGQSVQVLQPEYDSDQSEELPDTSNMSKMEKQELLMDVKLGIQKTKKILLDNQKTIKKQQAGKQLDLEEEIKRIKKEALTKPIQKAETTAKQPQILDI